MLRGGAEWIASSAPARSMAGRPLKFTTSKVILQYALLYPLSYTQDKPADPLQPSPAYKNTRYMLTLSAPACTALSVIADKLYSRLPILLLLPHVRHITACSRQYIPEKLISDVHNRSIHCRSNIPDRHSWYHRTDKCSWSAAAESPAHQQPAAPRTLHNLPTG